MNALEKRVRPDVHGLIQVSNSLNVEKKHLTQINKIALASCIQCGAKCFLAALTRNICNSPKSETLCFEIRPVLFFC